MAAHLVQLSLPHREVSKARLPVERRTAWDLAARGSGREGVEALCRAHPHSVCKDSRELVLDKTISKGSELALVGITVVLRRGKLDLITGTCACEKVLRVCKQRVA